MNNIVFAERLRESRAKAKLTQAELSKKAGVTAATISAYESTDENKQKKPSLESAYKIAKALNTSLDWLCGNDIYTQKTETEEMLKAIITLVFKADGASISVEHNPVFDQYSRQFILNLSPNCEMAGYLKKVLDLKEIYDKKILPNDMMATLKESIVDKYKNTDIDQLMKEIPMPLDDDLPF